MPDLEGQGAFKLLQQVHAARDFEVAFREATGLTVRLRPLPRQASTLLLEPDDNPICQLTCTTPRGREACQKTQAEVRHNFEQLRAALPVNCLAGLTIVAVPVRVCGKYVATLHTNRVLTSPPSTGHLRRYLSLLEEWGLRAAPEIVSKDLAALPVVPPSQLKAMIQLLGIYGEHLGDVASRRMMADQQGRPCAVAQAMAYMREHLTEHLPLRAVARQANLSPYYFCKLFHRTLGVTFTDYLARLRLERAKDLLLSPAIPVSDVATAAGFGSIPHFNRAFKRYTGTTPTAYRASRTARAVLPGAPPLPLPFNRPPTPVSNTAPSSFARAS